MEPAQRYTHTIYVGSGLDERTEFTITPICVDNGLFIVPLIYVNTINQYV
jgi:hypothetical protein